MGNECWVLGGVSGLVVGGWVDGSKSGWWVVGSAWVVGSWIGGGWSVMGDG